ncbi:MAG: type II secretion system secretin GspD [Deltaproteobacteria bacterium]|nr:type II secretion system secretin GspD [Deltaproteobacteria bacterium]
MKPLFSPKKACLVCYLCVAVAFAPAAAYAQPPAPEAAAPADAAKPKAANPISAAVRKMRRAAPVKAAPPVAAPPVAAPDVPPVAAPPPPAPPPAAAVAPAPAAGPGVVELPGEKEFNSCKKLPEKRIVKLNLKPDTELSELIGWISSITCTQFLIPSTTNIQGKKLTIISPQLITPREAYRLFLSAIESVGLTVEPSDRFLRIIETNRARFTQLPFLADGEPIPSDRRYVTRMVRLQHLDAADVTQNVLQRLKGEQGDIIAYQGDTLIITDQAAMIRKMVEVLEKLDQPRNTDERIWMVYVRNTTAVEMAQRLAEIFNVDFVGQGSFKAGKTGGAPTPRPAPAAKPAKGPMIGDMPELQEQMSISRLLPIDRTNQLIVVAKPLAYEWLKVMISRLDVPLDRDGDGRVHMYYCKYANCDELAVTLGAVTGVPVTIQSAGRTTGGGNRSTPPAAAPRPANANGQQQEMQLFEGDVRINFDRPTNALVIMSSLKDYQQLRKVIEKLDSPRKQVFIEALIMEVLLDKTRELGAAFHGGAPVSTGGSDKSLLIGGFRAASTLQPTSLLASGLGGLGGGLFGPTFDPEQVRIFGSSADIPSFGVFLQALQRNNDVNVLSNPYIIITNNDEGELSVGQQLPFPGSTFGAGVGGAGLPGAAGGLLGGFGVPVNRTKVALSLKLVPSVNEHNMIRMEVEQKIEDILSENFNNLGPATSLREAKTTVVTRDQQTVLIGGLMSDRTSESVTKVPILGDIPILGFFFRNNTKRKQKSNIIIALTPYVISEPSDLRRIAEKKMRERREFIERFTAFQDTAALESDVDYSKKRGLLEEINRSVREIEGEESEMREIRDRDAQDREVPIEPPMAVKWGQPGSRPARATTIMSPAPAAGEAAPQSAPPPVAPTPEAQPAPPPGAAPPPPVQ